MKREAKWQQVWSQYVRIANKNEQYFYYELKQTKTNSFPFSNFEPHQIHSLLALQKNGLVWKHSDADPRLKPCDGQSTPPLPTFVVIKFPGAFYMIPINDFLNEQYVSGKKSITLQESKKIAERVIQY